MSEQNNKKPSTYEQARDAAYAQYEKEIEGMPKLILKRVAWMATDHARGFDDCRTYAYTEDKVIAELVTLAKEGMSRAHEHHNGCLYCGEGEIIDGATTEEHQQSCWYYKGERTLVAFEAEKKKVGGK